MPSLRSLSQRATWAEGQPISDLMSRALAYPHLISLAAGFVDQQSLPVEESRAAIEAVFATKEQARAALQYGTTPGYEPLRDVLLERYLSEDGQSAAEAGVSLEQVVVTAGSNQLLHLIGESIMDVGDICLCAAPTYLVFMGTLANIGARSVGVACDEEGILPDALEDRLAVIDRAGQLSRVKAIYVVSSFDNPRGVTTSAARRQQIVEIARRWTRERRIHVIEDAAYRELRYSGHDVPSMRTYDPDGESVIYTGTFSKSFSPGIRVGWGVLPRHLIGPVCAQKGNIDFGSPNFSQHVMFRVLERGLYEPHVELLRRTYAEKLQAMLSAADRYFSGMPGVRWQRPTGGLYVWLELPEGVDAGPSGRLFDTAIEEGMFYVPGEYCFPSEGNAIQKNTIRLSFGVQSLEGIDRGMQALAKALERVLETERV